MTKRDIVNAVTEKTGVKSNLASSVVDAAFESIGDAVARGERVSIPGYLTIRFGVSKAIKKGTPTRNPFTGETSPHPGKPASLRLRVTAGKKLKDRVPGAGTKLGKSLIQEKK